MISVCCSLSPIPALTLRSGIARPIKTTCIDLNGLKNGRIKFTAKGSKYAATFHGNFQKLPLEFFNHGIFYSLEYSNPSNFLTHKNSLRRKFKPVKLTISIEAGCLIPGCEVVIADVSNNGQCGVGRLGEVRFQFVIK